MRPPPPTLQFEGYFSHLLDDQIHSAVDGTIWLQQDYPTAFKFRTDVRHGDGALFQMWEEWSADGGDVIAIARTPGPSSKKKRSCKIVKIPAEAHAPNPSLCTRTELISMSLIGSTQHGRHTFPLYSQSFPQGFPGSQMPNGSMLNISFDPLSAKEQPAHFATGEAMPEGYPMWHNLRSVDGRAFAAQFAMTAAALTVDVTQLQIPSWCSAEQPSEKPSSASDGKDKPDALVVVAAALGGVASGRGLQSRDGSGSKQLHLADEENAREGGRGHALAAGAASGCPFARVRALMAA
jgi:hypothetical protein